MEDLIGQTRAAAQSDLYYVALFAALALPDICGALESPDGMASRERYIEWFDRNVAPSYGSFLDGETCYWFRCSMLHQGSTQHPKSQYSRVIFVEPGVTTGILHNNVMNDALNIDVRVFCEDLCAAADAWLQGAREHPEFDAKLAKCVQRYPQGMTPYITGVAVIG